MKKNNTFTYMGYEIPKGFILRLKFKKKLKAYTIDRLIYRAVQYAEWIRENRGVKPPLINIMSKGIAAGWLFKQGPDEEYNKGWVEGWIDKEIYGKRPLPKQKPTGKFVTAKNRMKIPESIGEILKEIGV